MQCHTEFYWVFDRLGLARFGTNWHRGFTGFYRVSNQLESSFTWFNWVLTGFYWVSHSYDQFGPGFIEFYWVLLGFTGFYWVLLGFTGFYWVLPSFSGC